MPTDAILYATFDPATSPDGGDRLVACDALGRLITVVGVTVTNAAFANQSQKASALNALATAVIPAGGVGIFTYLHTVVVGFNSPAATEKLVQIKEGATVLLEFFVGKTSNPLVLNFESTFRQPTSNTGMTIELQAGGGGTIGKVNVTYHQSL